MSSTKIKNFIINICLIFFLLLFLYSAWNLYSIQKDYNEGTIVYEELTEIAVSIPEVNKEEIDISYENYIIDFDALYDTNTDIVAWIRFDNPEIINYPIVDANNNDTYLRRNIYKEYNTAGTLFIDQNNEKLFSDYNTIIYGHNMKNGSMFGQLSLYKEEKFACEYPYFYMYTPEKVAYKIQIFAVYEIAATKLEYYTVNFSDDESFLEYLDQIQNSSLYSIDATLDSSSKIITLSTCSNASSYNGRLLVQGVIIEEKAMAQN